jgi:hypothetical protein
MMKKNKPVPVLGHPEQGSPQAAPREQQQSDLVKSPMNATEQIILE